MGYKLERGREEVNSDGRRKETHRNKQSRALLMHYPGEGAPSSCQIFLYIFRFIPTEEMDLPSYQSLILLNVQIIKLKYSLSDAMFLTTQNP